MFGIEDDFFQIRHSEYGLFQGAYRCSDPACSIIHLMWHPRSEKGYCGIWHCTYKGALDLMKRLCIALSGSVNKREFSVEVFDVDLHFSLLTGIDQTLRENPKGNLRLVKNATQSRPKLREKSYA